MSNINNVPTGNMFYDSDNDEYESVDFNEPPFIQPEFVQQDQQGESEPEYVQHQADQNVVVAQQQSAYNFKKMLGFLVTVLAVLLIAYLLYCLYYENEVKTSNVETVSSSEPVVIQPVVVQQTGGRRISNMRPSEYLVSMFAGSTYSV